MPRSYDSIEGDIAKAREDLATTLDEIIDRVSPQTLAEEGKVRATALLKDPKVQAGLAGLATVVVLGVLASASSKRKHRKRVEAYLAARR